MDKTNIPMCFKAFDPNLCDEDKIQYEIGKETTVQNKFHPEYTAAWAHCDTTVKNCLINARQIMKFFPFAVVPRICEVRPTGLVQWKIGGIKLDMKPYYLTNTVEVVRELSQEEIVEYLKQESASFQEFLAVHAPFGELLRLKEQFVGLDEILYIYNVPYLTEIEKKLLTPEKYHKYIHAFDPVEGIWRL